MWLKLYYNSILIRSLLVSTFDAGDFHGDIPKEDPLPKADISLINVTDETRMALAFT